MVQPKVVSEMPVGAARRHYFPVAPGLVDVFGATVRLAFAPGLARRLSAAGGLLRALAGLRRAKS